MSTELIKETLADLTAGERCCYKIGLQSVESNWPLPTQLKDKRYWWVAYFRECERRGIPPQTEYLKKHRDWKAMEKFGSVLIWEWINFD